MRLLPLLLLPAMACGCAPHDARLGESVRTNMALQVIDPDPVFIGDEIEGGSGVRSAAAVERYRKDMVKQPVSIRTSSIGAAGGGAAQAR